MQNLKKRRDGFFLGIDEGTTGTTAILFDRNFHPAGKGYCEVTQYHPAPGCSEHDPEGLFAALLEAVGTAMKEAGAKPADILSVGLDHEGESALLFEAGSGRALGRSLVWQDRRTEARAAALRGTHGPLFRERTGLCPDSYFSATKMAWLLENTPRAAELSRRGLLLCGNMDAYLLYRLTGGKSFFTDPSTASRTLLYNLKTKAFDPELCAVSGVTGVKLPEILDSAAHFGMTDPAVFLGIRAPVGGLLCDQQAALFGQGCLWPGDLKMTFGTGAFLLMNTGEQPVFSKEGLITTVAYQLAGRTTYALDGGIYTAGSAMTFLRDNFAFLTSPREAGTVAASAAPNGNLFFVPAFTGLGAPWQDPDARGMIIGIDGSTTKAQIVRAAEEAIAFQTADLTAAMSRAADQPILRLRCDGGAAGDAFLMQCTADFTGIPVEVPAMREATALGAARMGAIGAGWADPKEKIHLGAIRRFEPQLSEEEREARLAGWHRAVARAGHWA